MSFRPVSFKKSSPTPAAHADRSPWKESSVSALNRFCSDSPASSSPAHAPAGHFAVMNRPPRFTNGDHLAARLSNVVVSLRCCWSERTGCSRTVSASKSIDSRAQRIVRPPPRLTRTLSIATSWRSSDIGDTERWKIARSSRAPSGSVPIAFC